MPTEPRAIRGSSLWRGLIIFCLVGLALGVFLGILLYASNREAISTNREAIIRSEEAIRATRQTALANRELTCRIGAFLVDFPVIKDPQLSQGEYEDQIRKARGFLVLLRKRDCAGLAGVTTATIDEQISKLRQEVPGAFRGGGGSDGRAPPSPGGGGSSPAPPGPSTPPSTPPPGSPPGDGGPPAPPGPPDPPGPPAPLCERLPPLCDRLPELSPGLPTVLPALIHVLA
jgi:hypothetical protein